MSDPADPARPRNPGRRAVDQAASDARLPVSTGPSKDAPRKDKSASAADAGVTAQMLGEGQRRGLKGGPETLERARTTYLGTEYSAARTAGPKGDGSPRPRSDPGGSQPHVRGKAAPWRPPCFKNS